jgi:hypothetical protein
LLFLVSCTIRWETNMNEAASGSQQARTESNQGMVSAELKH